LRNSKSMFLVLISANSGRRHSQGSATVDAWLPVYGGSERATCRQQWHDWASLHAGKNCFVNCTMTPLRWCRIMNLRFVSSLALRSNDTSACSWLLVDAVHVYSWRWKSSGELLITKYSCPVSFIACLCVSYLTVSCSEGLWKITQ
jgi:hypothetical protein